MTVWERGQVLALAPDTGSRSAAAALARADRWSHTGRHESVLWGRCQGSRPNPYLTAVVLDDTPAYSCSCPSRKFPCKHALALMLLASDSTLPAGEPPAASNIRASACLHGNFRLGQVHEYAGVSSSTTAVR